ncbi:unnamed protein product [marine sediment metagenome]|uniref:Uncharacterized protein n=1 Tax=marine sediment metagenome TaxID=412755 RepID=X1L0C9_9ZZZZ
MFWPFNIYRLMHPEERYVWIQARILHETNKAVLVDNGTKIWIPKSRIHGIKLRNNIFEIYVKESTVG